MNSPLQTWRDLLKWLIEDSAERQRAAKMLGVHLYTLTRWANREFDPHVRTLRKLPDVFRRIGSS